MARIVVVGGSISGLASALFLSRRGHHVTVLERDGHHLSTSLEEDFLAWRRPRVPQAVQPHGLLGPVRDALLSEAPDVYAAMLDLGAREHHEFDCFAEHPPYHPGDDRLVTVQTRRLVLEVTLRRALEGEDTALLLTGHTATGLTVDHSRDVPHITGVRTARARHPADLVLDCAGRHSPVSRWLAEAGCRAPLTESSHTGIAYYCRWYRTAPGAPKPGIGVRTGSASPFAIGGVFPSDNDTFALSFVLSTTDPTRSALNDPDTFETAARTFPAMRNWLTGRPIPLSPVLAMGGLNNRWTPLADSNGPVVTGILRVGDTLVHTNPTLGQGIALALRTAQWVAQQAIEEENPYDLARHHHQWALRELRPWYETQIAADQATEARLQAGISESIPVTSYERAAIDASAFEEPSIMRARARVRHLIDRSDRAYEDPDIGAALARWRSSHPRPEDVFDGPARTTWQSIV
ncbi:FAD-dependent oxidoreductase [Streptomyces sp. BE147]|uniref:NAD(P)/FAD-dependent oxidoreductase n=1 Tax=Streptomyces sp. BE147 TaxID=3002524 RepID=UPI002E79E60C|nr:FAD-dependent oxidoreductase [Streptomyces sp. BE147]MEE1736989.1 FAD-dependent oxidoreductase [Streptomyces sp. BE147]